MPRKTRLVCCQSLEYHTITSLASRFMPDVAKIAQYPILVGPLRFVHFFSIFCHTSCNFTSCLRLIVYNRQWLPCHYRAQPGPRCALAASGSPPRVCPLPLFPGLASHHGCVCMSASAAPLPLPGAAGCLQWCSCRPGVLLRPFPHKPQGRPQPQAADTSPTTAAGLEHAA